MPMAIIFAEMAAAEVAAAAAAEAAAVTAAEVAAAEAAQIAAAEAASTAAAQAATQAAAQQATQAGIMEIGGATANAPLTAEAVQSAAMNSGLPPGFEQQLQNVQNLSQGPSVQVASADPSAGIRSLQADIAPKGSLINGNFTNTTLGAPTNVTASVPGDISNAAMRSGVDPAFLNGPAPTDAMMRAGIDPSIASGPAPTDAMMRGFTSAPNMPPTTSLGPFNPPPSALEDGFTKAMEWADKNPFKASAIAYTGANMLGLMDPSGATFNQEKYDGPLSKYKLSPNFQAGNANPANYQYNPATNRRYATGGGIMGNEAYNIPVGYNEGGDMPEYAKGGSLSESIEHYQKMLDGKPQAAPAKSADVGIYYDQDPDTRYQDALTAAQIRQAKVNQRAYVSPPVAKRPTPLGKLNMPTSGKSKDSGDVEAAQGGIMQSNLGGYAAGGNPRLLKGPGDGMSDNIPATINGRQPARLADGEFVIPADVVSHLGNGSTEAGAKQLHAMMNKVRKARTGNPKQGKNIKPQKYMPK